MTEKRTEGITGRGKLTQTAKVTAFTLESGDQRRKQNHVIRRGGNWEEVKKIMRPRLMSGKMSKISRTGEGLPTKMESKHPVNADHSGIVKFESDSCQEFSQALSCLNECFAASRHYVRSNWPSLNNNES